VCGICGIASAYGDADPDRLAAMSAALVHRGPDSAGELLDGPVGLGFTRLSIVDPAGGDQPLTSGDLTQAFAALSAQTGTPAVSVSSAPISVTRFDALMVDQLGLTDAAGTFQAEATRAGLQPPSYFGTEVVARLLSD